MVNDIMAKVAETGKVSSVVERRIRQGADDQARLAV